MFKPSYSAVVKQQFTAMSRHGSHASHASGCERGQVEADDGRAFLVHPYPRWQTAPGERWSAPCTGTPLSDARRSRYPETQKRDIISLRRFIINMSQSTSEPVSLASWSEVMTERSLKEDTHRSLAVQTQFPTGGSDHHRHAFAVAAEVKHPHWFGIVRTLTTVLYCISYRWRVCRVQCACVFACVCETLP